MSDNLDQSFSDVTGLNWARPFNVGVTPFSPTVATIILMTKKQSNSAESDQVSTVFTNTFINKLETPSLSTGTGLADLNESKVAQLSLDNYSSHNYYGVFNNFSLTGVMEAKDQMAKIHMNFGSSWNAFFFGDKPTIYSFSGFFLDSKEYPYYQAFSVAYDKYLSGRKCVENQFEMFISYDGKIINGYMLNINTSIDGQNPYMKQFSFNVLVKNETWYRMNFYRDKMKGPLKEGLNALSQNIYNAS